MCLDELVQISDNHKINVEDTKECIKNLMSCLVITHRDVVIFWRFFNEKDVLKNADIDHTF